MTAQEMKIRIIEGKPGTATEGKLFIALNEGDQISKDHVASVGAKCSGTKGGVMLWLLPEGVSAEDAGRIVSEIGELKDQQVSTPAPEEPAAPEEAPVTLDVSTAPEDADATEEVVPEKATGKTEPLQGTLPDARSSRDFGYRAGMSIEECDSCRRPVSPGSVNPGDSITVAGIEREVFALSPVLSVADDMVANMQARFPDTEISAGMIYQFAMWPFEPEMAARGHEHEAALEV